MRITKIFSIVLVGCLFSLRASAQEPKLIIPKGEWQFGAQMAHASYKSDNSEILMLINPLNANVSAGMFSPFLSYAYRDNRTVGMRLNYFEANIAVDDLTLDLLNDGLSFDVSDLTGGTRTWSAALYHRNYFGLDDRGRFGVICEFALSYGGTHSNFASQPDSYTLANKAKLSFSPGFVVFVMNNVSTSLTVGMADVYYNNVSCYREGELTGTRHKLGTRFGLDLLGINMGISVHL